MAIQLYIVDRFEQQIQLEPMQSQNEGRPRRHKKAPARPRRGRTQPLNHKIWTHELRMHFNNVYNKAQIKREQRLRREQRKNKRRTSAKGQWRPFVGQIDWKGVYQKFNIADTQVRSYAEKYEKACQNLRSYTRRVLRYGIKYGRTRSHSQRINANMSRQQAQLLEAQDLARFINGIENSVLERQVIIDRILWKLAHYSSPFVPPPANILLPVPVQIPPLPAPQAPQAPQNQEDPQPRPRQLNRLAQVTQFQGAFRRVNTNHPPPPPLPPIPPQQNNQVRNNLVVQGHQTSQNKSTGKSNLRNLRKNKKKRK